MAHVRTIIQTPVGRVFEYVSAAGNWPGVSGATENSHVSDEGAA